MKAVLFLIITTVFAYCGELPTVKVYAITKFDSTSEVPTFPEVIIEIANPTEQTFYIQGSTIESPMYHVEALRENRWLRVPNFLCGTGTMIRPLKPGAKMLITVNYPFEETAARFRFFFFESDDRFTSKVVTVRSREIAKKEFGDLFGTIGELTSDKKLEEVIPDEEMNKSRSSSGDTDDPFQK